MIVCKFCNKEFSDRRRFGIHLATTEKHQFPKGDSFELHKEQFLVTTLFGDEYVTKTCKEYMEGNLCAHDISKSGKDIIKLLTLMGVKRSSKEERATKRYKTKYLASIQSKYGASITNISQVAEIQKKKESSYAKTHGSYDQYLSDQRKKMGDAYHEYVGTDAHNAAIQKQVATCETLYGARNFGAGDQAKKKRQLAHARTIASWDYEERLARTSAARAAVNHRGGFSSKPEKRVRHVLTELDIEFTTNTHLWNYNYDIVFENFILEVQGDMWHANPKKYKATDLIMGKIVAKDLWEKDKRKKVKAESNGYIVIAIWECDIIKKKDPELIEFVKSILLENGYVFS